MEQNQQSTAEQYSEQIEQLMELGRTQGYLTYAEINDLLPEDVIDPEYYDKLLQTLQHDLPMCLTVACMFTQLMTGRAAKASTMMAVTSR